MHPNCVTPKAIVHRTMSRFHSRTKGSDGCTIVTVTQNGVALEEPENPKLAEYHRQMSRKWERAASRPWEAVEPDPPAPESSESE